MNRTKNIIVISESIINRASKYFLSSDQSTKNKNIDMILSEHPGLIKYFQFLDEGHEKGVNKEIVVQIISIIFIALRFQKIKIKKIKFTKIERALDANIKMKRHFFDAKFEFDENGFDEFWKDYRQKNILSYTYFAINEIFRKYIEEERDAVFIFYAVKTISDVISESGR